MNHRQKFSRSATVRWCASVRKTTAVTDDNVDQIFFVFIFLRYGTPSSNVSIVSFFLVNSKVSYLKLHSLVFYF